MQKKNLIYIIGGAAVVGYFIWMKRKKQTDQVKITTPDQQIAPAFVNDATNTIKAVAKRIARKRKVKSPIDSQQSASQQISETVIQNSDGGITTVKEITPLSKKGARVEARSVKKEIKASGGTAKQARQAARSVIKNRMGELPVFF